MKMKIDKPTTTTSVAIAKKKHINPLLTQNSQIKLNLDLHTQILRLIESSAEGKKPNFSHFFLSFFIVAGGDLIHDFRGATKDYILSELERRKGELRTQLVWIGAQKEPGIASRVWKWVNGTCSDTLKFIDNVASVTRRKEVETIP